MNANELVAALESKTGEDFLDELSVRVFQPPLSRLRYQLPDRLPELPAALRVPILVIRFDIEIIKEGLGGFLDISSGHDLDDTIEALETIGAHSAAGTMRRVRAILVRHGIDLNDLDGIPWNRDEGSETDILAEADNLEGEDIRGPLQRFVEEKRDALLQAIRTYAGSTK